MAGHHDSRTIMRCPICGQWITKHTSGLPFCSERCRRIDLGRWLNEDYGIPTERADDDGENEDFQSREDHSP